MISNQPKFKLVLLGIDFSLLAFSFIIAVSMAIPDFWELSTTKINFALSHLTLFWAFATIFLFSFFFCNVYKRNVIVSRHRHFFLILKAFLFGCGACTIILVVTNFKYLSFFGKDLLPYFFLISFFSITFYRVVLVKSVYLFLAQKNRYQTRLLIVGGDNAGQKVAHSLEQDGLSSFHIVGFLDDFKEIGTPITETHNNLGKIEDLQKVIKEHNVDEILIAIDQISYGRLIHLVEHCLNSHKVVRIYSDFLVVIADKLKVEYYANIPVVMLSQYSLDDMAWRLKRILDIILASTAFLLLSPVFLCIVLAIKLSSPGPVIFKQTRIGKGGKPFDFFKFRSMHVASDSSKHKEYVQDFIKKGKQECGKDINVFKMTDDPRIFKVGKFIRKTSLDEFPQLFNVIKGDMTLVGPRPCLPYEWECYDDWHKNRLNILPGCTGLWQALGRSTVSFEEMVILDLYYISNMSLWLDFRIVMQTFPVIFFGKGGY